MAWIGALLMLGSSPCYAQTDADAAGRWGVSQLMQTLKQVESARARFVEKKYMAILNTPLEFTGTLIYAAPARLEKHTLRPKAESMILDRDSLTLENKEKNQRRTIALQDYPVVWAFVESIRSTLAGDLETLNRFYRVSLSGDAERWRLTLQPTESTMQKAVKEILIGGSGNSVTSIEFREAEGDRSVMSISRDPS